MLLPRVTGDIRLTAGMARLAILAAFIVAIGMIRTHLTHRATMIEMLTAFALLTAYLSSFVDWHRREPSVREDLG